MGKLSKRMKETQKVMDITKTYSLPDALQHITKFPKPKFDETVELHFNLAIDPKLSDQSVRGTVVLPHGTGKKVRIAVFCKGEHIQKAKDMGADYVGTEDLIEKVSQGFMDFDCCIATPDMMRDLSKLGKILGPRGLMPSPKAGTVTMDIGKAITEVRAGKIEFKSDKQGDIHLGIGKRSFTVEELLKNATHVMEAINQLKPPSVKGALIKKAFLSTTMGIGIKLTL